MVVAVISTLIYSGKNAAALDVAVKTARTVGRDFR